mmetsp:Transcript_6851/g.19383  ORF Transcript_6851/g.19383 Transcript_6851/m.19383 type:complete len:120 (+) Transcript_6851:80-439(+)
MSRDSGSHMREVLEKDAKGVVGQVGRLSKSLVVQSEAPQELQRTTKRMVTMDENMSSTSQNIDRILVTIRDCKLSMNHVEQSARHLEDVVDEAKELHRIMDVTAVRMREGDARIAASLV